MNPIHNQPDLTEAPMVTLTVNDQTLSAPEGASLLAVCLEHDIYIPHLCHIPGLDPPQASCRLCWVEIAGQPAPVTACTVKISAGLKVHTDTEAVRDLQRSGLRLLLSVHDIACKECPANRRCPLQDLARYLKFPLKAKPLECYLKTPDIDRSHPCIDYYQNRCVLCGRCIRACDGGGQGPQLAFAKRGFATVIRYFNLNPAAAADCRACRACVSACPVAALRFRESGG